MMPFLDALHRGVLEGLPRLQETVIIEIFPNRHNGVPGVVGDC